MGGSLQATATCPQLPGPRRRVRPRVRWWVPEDWKAANMWKAVQDRERETILLSEASIPRSTGTRRCPRALCVLFSRGQCSASVGVFCIVHFLIPAPILVNVAQVFQPLPPTVATNIAAIARSSAVRRAARGAQFAYEFTRSCCPIREAR